MEITPPQFPPHHVHHCEFHLLDKRSCFPLVEAARLAPTPPMDATSSSFTATAITGIAATSGLVPSFCTICLEQILRSEITRSNGTLALYWQIPLYDASILHFYYQWMKELIFSSLFKDTLSHFQSLINLISEHSVSGFCFLVRSQFEHLLLRLRAT